MGNSHAFSFGCIALVLLALAFPLFTHAASRADIADRLIARMCSRQAELSARLPRPIISPSICNPAPEPEPTLSFSVDPTNIALGEDATLTWNSTNTTSCTASNGWSGAQDLSGEEIVSPEETTTYELSCTGAGGSVAQSVTVTVAPAPEAPTVDITADPLSITEGGTSELSWTSTNATSCTASNAWVGARDLSGTEDVTPNVTSTYAISCTGLGGVANDSVTITVSPVEPEVATLTLTKTVINDNDGTAVADDFQAQLDGVDVAWSVATEVTVGAHTASEINLEGYTASDWGGDCAADGSVTVAAGEDKTCTITNDDVAPDPDPTITAIVVADDRFDTLETAVIAAGLDDDLGGAGPLTVFAPTDDAFDALPEGVLASLLADPTGALRDVLLYHVVAGEFDAAAVAAADVLTTLLGPDVDITVEGENVRVNDALITVADVQASNGIIHIIDAVLTPPAEPEGSLRITEVLYDLATSTPAQGEEPANEWVEIWNGTNASVNLSDYTLADASSVEVLPDVVLPAGAYAIITASSTTADFYTFPEGTVVVVIGGSIGNGLGNGGDSLQLLDAEANVIDALSWGTVVDVFNPSVPTVAANSGNSIGRTDHTVDTDTAVDWQEQLPNPGE